MDTVHGGLIVTEERYRASEAGMATGIDVIGQLDWRRRGFLSRQSGHSRAGLVEVCRVRLMVSLSALGLGPMRSRHVSEMLAPRIALQVLTLREAYATDARLAVEDPYHVAPDDVRAELLSPHADAAANRLNWFRAVAARALGLKAADADLATQLRVDPGSGELVEGDHVDDASSITAPVVTVRLARMAEEIVAALPRPPITLVLASEAAAEAKAKKRRVKG